MRTASVYVLALSLLAISQMAKALDCQALTNVKLADTRVTEAQSIPAGSFTPDGADPIKHVDSFCRVSGVITPTADSYIRFEVWLPENWNGKYLGVGNGGFAGSIAYSALANNVNAGYATAATDTGHQAEGVDASWAYKHPEKITDFGYRALHLTTLNAKSLVKQFYQKTPDRSYFSSCSDGGREALMEAQRFPADFDGILAGAPANYWTHLVSNGIGLTKQLVSPAGYISAFKLSAIHKAALDTCDAVDGVKDGVINDPTRCHFDPAILLCKEHESTHCLTAPQIDTLHSLYSGSKDSKGNSIFPGFIPGSEDGWNAWIIGFGPGGSYQYVYLVNYFRYMVYDDPAWNVFRASVDDAEKRAEQTTAHALDAVNPDLHAFQSRGGKLILYHGWNDAAIPAGNTINYFENVKKTMGSENALKFVRLYMVPGMQHCGGGPGVNSFGQGAPSKTDTPANNAFTALQEWVETGKAPEQITATKYVGDSSSKGVAFTRPLCPYPQIAKYSGSGDTKDAANFSCAAN